MNMAMVLTEVTPSTNRMPMFSRPRNVFSPNGTTATTISVGTSRTTGARSITQRSASSGVVSSFVMSLTRSAMGWSTPYGPHRLGPSLFWNLPRTRRSNHVYTAVDITIALMTINASSTAPAVNTTQSRLSGAKPSRKS